MFHFVNFISIQIGKMSQMYIMEPPTNGKIVLRTSAGDIDIELWVSYVYIYSSQFIFLAKRSTPSNSKLCSTMHGELL